MVVNEARRGWNAIQLLWFLCTISYWGRLG
jgi:hypothetical protein